MVEVVPDTADLYIPLPDDIWDIENSFYLRSDATRIAKLLAQYEIYKKIIELPGAIIECGVFKGASFSRLASFRRALESEESREMIGLDAFGCFPRVEGVSSADRAFIEDFERTAGVGMSDRVLTELLVAKGHRNFSLIAGDVMTTVPALLANRPELRVALLHLDLDVYGPTRLCLDMLVDRMVPGGIVVFDDFNAVEGATRAAEELCAERDLAIQKLSFYNVPSYVRL